MKLSQSERIRRLLADGEPHSTIEMMEKVYGGSHLGIARVGARIYDLKGKGCAIIGWKDEKNPTVYWYQMHVRPEPKVEFVEIDGVMHARMSR